MKAIAALTLAVSLVSIAVTARAENVVSPSGRIVVAHRAAPNVDLAHMKPMPIPMVHGPLLSPIDLMIAASKTRPAGEPMAFSGGEGDRALRPVSVPRRQGSSGQGSSGQSSATAARPPSGDDGVGPQEYGSSGQVFTTSRVPFATTTPYRKAGLVTANGALCSGALIKRGIVVTAAHCVIDWNSGSAYGGWVYYPAAKNGATPYPGPASDGGWPVYSNNSAYATGAYIGGARDCSSNPSTCDCNYPSTQTQDAGIICTDDVALLALQPDANGKFAGDYTGWFGYATNSYGYSSGQAQITQLGYPGDLDSGQLMQRTDARGYTDPNSFNNTIIGTLMSSGASGGPWVENFGAPPKADSSVAQGNAPRADIIVGVTSWAYTCNCGASSLLQSGASPFLKSNIQTLLSYACSDHPGNC